MILELHQSRLKFSEKFNKEKIKEIPSFFYKTVIKLSQVVKRNQDSKHRHNDIKT